jgi:hypothetical protein
MSSAVSVLAGIASHLIPILSMRKPGNAKMLAAIGAAAVTSGDVGETASISVGSVRERTTSCRSLELSSAKTRKPLKTQYDNNLARSRPKNIKENYT